ncbi:MAG: TonB-dependent receptor [Candidatus Binatia bacterium]
MPGIGVPKDQIPANVQAATSADIRSQRPLSLADFMNENLAGVHINDAQSSPFQPDVSFRGFTASPLLGSPIGISVFVDGVRVNESFGDTVLWDLIPTAAISTIDLIPGSNPVFGLNTLGGALAVRTKSGRTDPGLEAEFSGGSYERRSALLSYGGKWGGWDAFVAAQHFEEDGWRDHSPARVSQFFGKVGWQSATADVDVSYTYADNKLIGNGLVPESLLRQHGEAVYTFPDETKPELNFVNLTGSHALTGNVLLTGNVYYRWLTVGTFNGDAEFEDGGTPLDPTDDEVEAENRRTHTVQRTAGGTLQLTHSGALGGLKNQFTVGASHDEGRAEFSQFGQAAEFTPERGTIGEGEFERNTFVRGRNEYDGLYLTDTLSLADRLHLTLSGRYNRARLSIKDLSGEEPELNGSDTFSRLNPAIGATWAVAPVVTLYASYNEGFRVPTPVELTCADPDAPCSLPVSFVADPPLDPVIAKTWEAGARGRLSVLNWNVTGFRTDLQDDILFTAVGGSQGFFSNVPKTRRQGVELGLSGKASRATGYFNYAYLDATFESSAELFNPVANPLDPSQPETISVKHGDRLPGIPRHVAKLGGEFRFTDAFSVGGNVIYASSQFLRGDEGNDHSPLSAYTVVNLRADYRVAGAWRLFANVDNVFDVEYETVGAFNRNGFDTSGKPLEGVGPGQVERFVSPGAPRGFWVGVAFSFGAKSAGTASSQ